MVLGLLCSSQLKMGNNGYPTMESQYMCYPEKVFAVFFVRAGTNICRQQPARAAMSNKREKKIARYNNAAEKNRYMIQR